MRRVMSVEDFKVWKELANKYFISWELISMGNYWVDIYIG